MNRVNLCYGGLSAQIGQHERLEPRGMEDRRRKTEEGRMADKEGISSTEPRLNLLGQERNIE